MKKALAIITIHDKIIKLIYIDKTSRVLPYEWAEFVCFLRIYALDQ